MKARMLLLAAVCAVSLAFYAQQTATPINELKAIATVEVSAIGSSSANRWPICDSAGNVYTRQLEPEMKDRQQRAALPIDEISPAGVLVRTYRVTDAFASEVSGNGVAVLGKGVFVTGDGRVYQAALVHSDIFVVEFARDGSVKAKTKLMTNSFMQPWHLAVFDEGEYLLTATAGKDNLSPFTGVFAADGRLIKSIYEPEDEEAKQRSSPTDWSAPGNGGNGGTDFVSYGDVTIGSDGNAYLLHGTTSPGLIYVISPRGDVVRKFRVEVGNRDLIARSIKSYSGLLAVQFDKSVDVDSGQNLISVSDLLGNPKATYRMWPVVGNHSLFLAGFGRDGLTFLPYFTEDKLYLVRTKLP